MKYELDKPYVFEVKNCIRHDNGDIFLEVEIEGNLFPVRAYEKQIEDGYCPSTVVCRIKLDKEKNAFLVQDNRVLYPLLYKDGHKYIFEVTGIGDSHIQLTDKFGIDHIMPKDGLNYSCGEIIVRNVNIMEEDNGDVSLFFPCGGKIIQPDDAPSRQEHDTALQSAPRPGIKATEQARPEKTECKTIIKPDAKTVEFESLLSSERWDEMTDWLRKNYKKTIIPSINESLKNNLETCDNAMHYRDAVIFFIKYNARVFIDILASANVSHLKSIKSFFSAIQLSYIIEKAFSVQDKLEYAIALLMPCKDILLHSHKNSIKKKCVKLSTPESFMELFILLGVTIDSEIKYLLTLSNNPCAAFTIYKIYHSAKANGCIKDNIMIYAFKPATVLSCAQEMESLQSPAFTLAANLIKCNILGIESCPEYLEELIDKNGYDGFRAFLKSM